MQREKKEDILFKTFSNTHCLFCFKKHIKHILVAVN